MLIVGDVKKKILVEEKIYKVGKYWLKYVRKKILYFF